MQMCDDAHPLNHELTRMNNGNMLMHNSEVISITNYALVILLTIITEDIIYRNSQLLCCYGSDMGCNRKGWCALIYQAFGAWEF
jgi:hypothetical protein